MSGLNGHTIMTPNRLKDVNDAFAEADWQDDGTANGYDEPGVGPEYWEQRAKLNGEASPVELPRGDEADDDDFKPIDIESLVINYPHLHDPVIEDLLRRGETMNVISSPKVGKSWLMYGLALATATGCKWLDMFQCRRGRVLFVDNELHCETLAHRIPKVAECMGLSLCDCRGMIALHSLRGRDINLESLKRYLHKIEPGEFSLVILDAFYRAIPSGTDENSNSSIAQLYNTIDHYAAKLDAAWVNVHHSTKGSQAEKSVTDVGSGAGSQSRAADTHFILRPHEVPDCFTAEAAVRSFAPIKPVVLRHEHPLWYPVDDLDPASLKGRSKGQGERKKQEDEDRLKLIVSHLHRHADDHTMRTPNKVASLLGCGVPKALQLLGKLEIDEVVAMTQEKVHGNKSKVFTLVKSDE